MSQDLLDSLLGDIPTEEVRDERLGVHDDAVLASDVTVTTNEFDGKLLYSLVTKFKITDSSEKEAFVQTNISLPDAEAPTGYKQQLLSWLHAFKLVPLTSKQTPLLPGGSEEDRRSVAERIAAAVNTRVGEVVGVTVYEKTGKNAGFVGVRANRPKA
jgi:hypothetical protein